MIYIFTEVLKKSSEKNSNSNLFEAGDISAFENNRIYPFSAGQFYLSRLKDGGFLAISTKCTHLGCTIQYNTGNNRFLCPCHASAFNKFGEVLSPPATRALDIFPITIKAGKIYVDIMNPVKRKKHSSSQIIYA